jgi:hypothetical protein
VTNDTPGQQLLQYLKGFASLSKDEPHKSYYDWQIANSQIVVVSSYKDHPELKKLVDTFLKQYKPKFRQCYHTAYTAATLIPGVEYIAGIAGSMIPLDHGWNCWNGIYFDLTAEVLFDKGHFATEYLQVLKLQRDEVFEMSLITEDSGPYIAEYYRLRVLGEKPKKLRRHRG